MNKDDLLKKLTPLQFSMTQQNGTEPPFKSQAFTRLYYNNHLPGRYNCVVCSVPLFLSEHKFDSGSGWPSFDREAVKGACKEIVDRKFGMVRTEVRCNSCNSHLGHVFDDGPQKTTGLRYCINSASLDFQPK